MDVADVLMLRTLRQSLPVNSTILSRVGSQMGIFHNDTNLEHTATSIGPVRFGIFQSLLGAGVFNADGKHAARFSRKKFQTVATLSTRRRHVEVRYLISLISLLD